MAVSAAHDLDEKRRRMLEALLEEEGLSPGGSEAIRPRPKDQAPVLSFAQERFWFLDRWDPGNPAYNIDAAFALRGRLDAGALAGAFGELIGRHESLRSRFGESEGRPTVEVLDRAAVEMERHDLLDLPEEERQEVRRRFLAEWARRRFDLGEAPLLRAALLRTGENEHLLVLSVHHIVADGWSMGVLMRELVAIYAAATAARPSPLPPLSVQYPDFALWQRDQLSGERLEAQLAYWHGHLAGAPAAIELPFDRPRSPARDFAGGSIPFEVERATVRSLRKLARQERATDFMVLLAGFAALLAREGAGPDLVVGTPIANRRRPEIEGLIGLFVNTLAIRCDLSGDPNFAEIVGRARRAALGAYDHQDLPFEHLVDELAPAREISHAPVFQVVLVLQNTAPPSHGVPGLEISYLPVEVSTAKTDLTLGLVESEERIGGSLEYAAALFDAATVERLGHHLSRLLGAAVERPELRLSELPLLSSLELRQLTVEWAGGGAGSAETFTLHERFVARARARPEAEAVSYGDRRWTYAELDRAAGAVARRLRALGVRLGDRVAVLLETSLELIAAIVGTLEAGAAYVPIDPRSPAARLSFQVEDAGVRAVLTESALADRLPAGLARVLLDGEANLPAEDSGEMPVAASDPELPAYVIYTSGSTGAPKGVEVAHAQVARLFLATERWFEFGPDDVWTLFHSAAFDFSVWEIWGALLYGGRLVVVPHEASRAPEVFLKLLGRERVTVLNQTPSAFRQLVAADEAAAGRGEESPEALRWVIFGGEALEVQALRPWLERHGEARPRLINMYGITETTVHVTYRPVGLADLASPGASPIGEPIPDLSVYLLGRGLALVPLGVPGEICVGGSGLARGYLGRPDLTAERFVPDPFGSAPGGRLYRSGDLARFRETKGAAARPVDLDYLGRIDQQVKIRGFRIELGEIEAHLLNLPGVREAVVQPFGTPEARLAAYWVEKEGETVDASTLREGLKERLPDYMVPAVFVRLGALPLTGNGKVDRRALPEPDGARPDLTEDYIAPRDGLERLLAEIWADVLGVRRVGVNDNFFALGGDSIRSIRVLAGARARGIELDLPRLFRHQTVAELALAVSAGEAAPAAQRSRPFESLSEADRSKLPEDAVDAYPLAYLQAGMFYHLEQRPDSPAYHNVDSIHLRAPFEPGHFREALDAVVARHPILRTSFHLAGFSEPLQVVHRAAEMPLEIEDLRAFDAAEQEARIARRIAEESRRLFDPTRAPLLRFHLARRSEETFQLTFTENHAIFDGWSLHATLREMFDHYLALFAGERPARKPPLLVTYRDFVLLERRTIQAEETRRFWVLQLSGYTPGGLPRWPSSYRSGARPRMRTVSVPVAGERVEALRRNALGVGAPLKSALLAAHVQVMSWLSGEDDVVTGLASNGRIEELDGDEVRGLFLNMLPLRLELNGGTWLDLVRAAFVAETEILPHRRFPLGEIQKSWGPRPLFETAFTYVHFHAVEELVKAGPVGVLDFKRSEATHFPFATTFTLSPVDGRLTLLVDCDRNELADPQIDVVADLFGRALYALAETPDAHRDTLRPLSPEEAATAISTAASNARDLGAEERLHRLFEAQADETPENVAVEDAAGIRLTYRDLDRRANGVANALFRLGVRPDDRVAVSLERSADLVVALLGVLKAGAGYLPIDGALPGERLAFLLRHGRPAALIAGDRETGVAALAVEAGIPVFDLGPDFDRESAGRPAVAVAPESLAYVIYTSGSTGEPKGVAVSHRAIANRVLWMRRRFPLSADDRVAQKTPFVFDASIWELFLPLFCGARVVLAAPGAHRDSGQLARWVADSGVSILQLVPSMLAPFLAEPESAAACRGLRHLFCGGESLSRDLAARLSAEHPALALHNTYGPTEAAIDVSSFTCPKEIPAEWTTVPIGRPIDNVGLYVLDRRLQPVPMGVPGELWIAGRNLARGYLERPDLTADRFRPDPFAEAPGERCYRSGDRVRVLPDGELEHLGRNDLQTKIRGFRIEPGEIEAALARHPAVVQAAVAVREDVPGERRLVAYAVAAGEPPPASTDLRAHLAASLPEHMVPAAVVVLRELPRLPSGKLDRRALPKPEEEAPDFTGRAPKTPVEEIVAGICAGLLGVEAERIDIGASFAALGGHSLLAIQLALRLRKTFEVELRVRHVLQAETLAGLAREIERSRAEHAGLVAPPLEPAPRDGSVELVLSFAQQRLWVLHAMAPESPVFNIPMAVKLRGEVDVPLLERCFAEVVRRHEALRSIFVAIDGEPRLGIAPSAAFKIPVDDLSSLAGSAREAEASRRAALELARPFDLERGPLLRFRLLRLDPGEHVGLLTIHHIVGDGWSTGLLLRELAAIYGAFGENRPSPLAELPIQYVDFARWQRSWLAGEVIEREIEGWRSRLAGAPAVLDLPSDRPRPATRSPRGGVTTRLMPASLGAAIRALATERGATPFMALFALFAALLGTLSGRDDLVVGTDVAGRDRLETEDLIGFFVNQLPLRISLAGRPSLSELIDRARRCALDAYAHQELPFEKLVQALRPERSSAHAPIFQVKLNLQNLPARRRELPGLAFSQVPFERSVAELDLTLNLIDGPGGLFASAEFSRDLFDKARIAALLESYEAVLALAADRPDATLDDVAARLAELERGRRAASDEALGAARERAFRSVRRTPIAGGTGS